MSDTDKNQMLVGAKKYYQLIPDEYKNMTVQNLFITTYSLEFKALKTFLGALIKDDIIELEDLDKNIQIYYDSLRLTHDCNNFLPKECYHEIKRTERKPNFHPKIVLLDYGKENGFVIIVLSKNISSSNAIEAYAVAHDNGETDDKEHNGKAVADFFGSFTKLDESVRERLEKTNFVMDDVKNVSFLTGNDVYKKITEDDKPSELTIVSPFVTEKFVKKLHTDLRIYSNAPPRKSSFSKRKIKLCHPERRRRIFVTKVSRRQRFFVASLLRMTNRDAYILKIDFRDAPLCTESYVHHLDKDFHSKIYCWQKDNKTNWIIGSSNATANGLPSEYDKGNYEFNICFETKWEDYNKFCDGLKDCFEESNVSKAESQREEARKAVNDILDYLMLHKTIKSAKNCRIEVEFEIDDGTKSKLKDLPFIKIFLKTGETESTTRIDLLQLNSNTFSLELKSKELFEYFDVVSAFKVYENDNEEKIYRTHFPLEWEDNRNYINQKAMAELKKCKSELDKTISFEMLIDKSVTGDQELIEYMEQLLDEQKDEHLMGLLKYLKKEGGRKK